MKKSALSWVLLLLSFFSLCSVCHAAGSWKQVADFPGMGMREPLHFSVGGKGYVGITEFYHREFWQYDPSNNSWSQKGNLPYGFSFQAPSFVIKDKAYVVIGVNVWQYDPTSDEWTQKNDIPGDDKRNAFSFTVGNKGYVGGGFYDRNHLYEYDADTDTWTQKNDIPKLCPYYNDPNIYAVENVTFTIGKKAYVTGTNIALWEYDPTNDSWAIKKTGIYATYAVASSIENKGYIFNAHGEIWEYDPAANTLVPGAPFPGAKVCYPAAFEVNDKMYIGLGGFMVDNTCTLNKSNDVWRFTPKATEIAFSDFKPAPNSVIEQELNPLEFLSITGWTKLLLSFNGGDPTSEINLLKSVSARLNLQPITHSVDVCSKGSQIDLGSVHVLLNGKDVTAGAAIVPWASKSGCDSAVTVSLQKYWVDSNDIDVKVTASTMDGVSNSSEWQFSVNTGWLWKMTKDTGKEAILRKLAPIVDVLEALLFPLPAQSD